MKKTIKGKRYDTSKYEKLFETETAGMWNGYKYKTVVYRTRSKEYVVERTAVVEPVENKTFLDVFDKDGLLSMLSRNDKEDLIDKYMNVETVE